MYGKYGNNVLKLVIFSVFYLFRYVHKAVESVVDEPRFRLPTPNGPPVLRMAAALSAWMKDLENGPNLEMFCTNIVQSLRQCYLSTPE